MRLLVDTCTFLWLAADDAALSPAARAACIDPANEVFLSAVSAWEIAIKHHLGRLPLPVPPPLYVTSRRQWLGLEPLDLDEVAAAHTHLLPDLHRDPFDRALVAQAILNGLTLVTPDPLIRAYPAPTLF
ncbi:MAG: type II toxin-antitoxin system VapC family toxin [Polyangia bacterium]|jgi:PIN domain nuclease of toxin-antitoxin system|nr:type II toxin-antitoxin system VapC family toxin [Polyangia bacterium]